MTKSRRLFGPTLKVLEMAFRQLEVRVSAPIRKPWLDSFVFRYADQTIQQAIVQKLARTISGLHAVDALSERGLFQEQGMVQRALDEIEEDIWFLALGLIRNDITPRHKEYLKYFYAEEFENPEDITGSHISRGMVKREKIRGYIHDEPGADAARAKTVGKIIAKAYSGFVHAASPQIMDMCGGLPPRFDVSGELRNFRAAEHERDALNYFYRALLTMALAAKALGDEALFSKMQTSAAEVEAAMKA
jgi:hypothetical protein